MSQRFPAPWREEKFSGGYIVRDAIVGRNDGTRRTTRYDIDMVKCIYCGLCQEAYRLCLGREDPAEAR